LIDGFAPQHLALEDAPKIAGGGVKGLLYGWLTVGVGFELEAGDLAIGDAAGDDPVEIAKICRYVQREAVGSDALRDVDPDGSDFLFADAAAGHSPDACEFADALGHDAEVAAGAD